MIDKLQGWARRHRGFGWLVTVLAVQKRFGEVQGGHLAASITLMAFLSIFPLMVVGVAVVGFVASAGTIDVPGRMIEALGLPAGGEAASQIRDSVETAQESRRAATVVGLAGLLWAGLGLVGALQNAYNSVWQVRGRGLRDRVAGLLWLVGAALIFLLSFAVTAAISFLPAFLTPVNVVVGAAISFGLFMWSARVLANRDVGWWALLPGALLGAIGFEILKVFGAVYVPQTIANSSSLYGSIGLVFALLAWLFFFGRLLVYSAVLNVVRWEHDHGTTYTTIEVPRLPEASFVDVTRSGRLAG